MRLANIGRPSSRRSLIGASSRKRLSQVVLQSLERLVRLCPFVSAEAQTFNGASVIPARTFTSLVTLRDLVGAAVTPRSCAPSDRIVATKGIRVIGPLRSTTIRLCNVDIPPAMAFTIINDTDIEASTIELTDSTLSLFSATADVAETRVALTRVTDTVVELGRLQSSSTLVIDDLTVTVTTATTLSEANAVVGAIDVDRTSSVVLRRSAVTCATSTALHAVALSAHSNGTVAIEDTTFFSQSDKPFHVVSTQAGDHLNVSVVNVSFTSQVTASTPSRVRLVDVAGTCLHCDVSVRGSRVLKPSEAAGALLHGELTLVRMGSIDNTTVTVSDVDVVGEAQTAAAVWVESVDTAGMTSAVTIADVNFTVHRRVSSGVLRTLVAMCLVWTGEARKDTGLNRGELTVTINASTLTSLRSLSAPTTDGQKSIAALLYSPAQFSELGVTISGTTAHLEGYNVNGIHILGNVASSRPIRVLNSTFSLHGATAAAVRFGRLMRGLPVDLSLTANVTCSSSDCVGITIGRVLPLQTISIHDSVLNVSATIPAGPSFGGAPTNVTGVHLGSIDFCATDSACAVLVARSSITVLATNAPGVALFLSGKDPTGVVTLDTVAAAVTSTVSSVGVGLTAYDVARVEMTGVEVSATVNAPPSSFLPQRYAAHGVVFWAAIEAPTTVALEHVTATATAADEARSVTFTEPFQGSLELSRLTLSSVAVPSSAMDATTAIGLSFDTVGSSISLTDSTVACQSSSRSYGFEVTAVRTVASVSAQRSTFHCVTEHSATRPPFVSAPAAAVVLGDAQLLGVFSLEDVNATISSFVGPSNVFAFDGRFVIISDVALTQVHAVVSVTGPWPAGSAVTSLAAWIPKAPGSSTVATIARYSVTSAQHQKAFTMRRCNVTVDAPEAATAAVLSMHYGVLVAQVLGEDCVFRAVGQNAAIIAGSARSQKLLMSRSVCTVVATSGNASFSAADGVFSTTNPSGLLALDPKVRFEDLSITVDGAPPRPSSLTSSIFAVLFSLLPSAPLTMTRCTGTLRIGAAGATGALPPYPDVVKFVGGWSFYSALYMLDNTWTVKDSEGGLAPDKFTFLRTSGPLVVFPTLNPRDVGNVTVRCDRVVGRSDSLVSADEIAAAFDPRPPNFADFVITVHRGCTATPSLLPPRTPTEASTGTTTPSPTTTGPWSATLSSAPTLTQSLLPSTTRTASLPPPPTDTRTPAPTRTVSGSTSVSQRPPQPRCDTTLLLIGGATTGHALRERGAVLTLAVPDTLPVTFESDVAVLQGSVLVSGEVRNGDEAVLRSAREDPRSLGQQLSKARALVEFAVPPHPPPDVAGAALPAPFSRLMITVPPMPGLLLRPSVTSLLTVTVMPTAVSCAAAANSTSVVVSVEVEPSVPPALAAAADAATAAGTVATAAAIGSVAAAADLQTVAALSLMQCGGSSEEASRRTSWLLGPLNIGGGSIGAIGGTLVLLAAATFLPLTIAAVVSVVRRHRAKQSCDGVSGSKADWRSVTALVKFPSLQLKLLNLAVPGLAAHSFTLLFRSDIEPLALFSAALCLAAPVGIVLLARYAASPRFEDGPDRLQFLKYAAISTTAWGPAVRSGPRWALFCAVVPVGRWGPPQVTARVGSPFTQLRPIWAEAFAAEPWLTAAAAGFVVSVPVAPGPWCAAQFGLLIAVTCVGTAAATYAKPYRVPALLYLRVASTVLLTAVIACVMLVALEADTAAPSSTLYSVITGLSVLQAFLTALRAVYSVGLKVAEMCFWNEDSRRHPWIDGLSVLHRPELPCNDALGLLHTSASVECPSPSLGSTPYAASPVLSATKGIGSGHSFSTVSSNRSPYRRPPRLGSVPLKKGRRRPESKWAEEEEEEPFQL